MSGPLRLAVLGDPIGHSRSPAIHNAAMSHLGIDGTYEARRAGVPELEAALAEMRAGDLHGVNVTMPLKRAAASAADTLTAEARASGSVNTLRLRAGSVEGHSTDVVASRAALADPRFEAGTPILVLGSGGAAAAVLIAARGRVVYLAARNEVTAGESSTLTRPSASLVRFGSAVAGALVVNATPLGMNGESIPSAVLGPASGVIDLAYGEEATPAVRTAIRIGLPVIDGVEFLVLQAMASFEWWTGVQAPFEVMLTAARKA